MTTPFISRDDLSDYIGRDVTQDDGALIAVDSACEMVRTLTEQDLDQVLGDTAILDGTGTEVVLLPEVPVSAAGTVTVNGGTVTNFIAAENGELIRTWGTASFTTGHWPWGTAVWPEGRQNITVTYDHGYAGTVPADLRMVALSIASRLAIQGVATAESVGMNSITYGMNATDLTNGEKAIIRKHRAR